MQHNTKIYFKFELMSFNEIFIKVQFTIFATYKCRTTIRLKPESNPELKYAKMLKYILVFFLNAGITFFEQEVLKALILIY